MKKLFALFSLSFASLTAMAAPPTDESIRTLFTVMKAESMGDGLYASMEQGIRAGIAQARGDKELSPEQRKLMDRIPQKMIELMRIEMSWSKMEPIQIKAYRETFEQSEIDGLIEFYRSPVGQSYVNKMPIAIQKATTETTTHMQQVMLKLRAAMQQMIADIKAGN